jgi:hypothetical protein
MTYYEIPFERSDEIGTREYQDKIIAFAESVASEQLNDIRKALVDDITRKLLATSRELQGVIMVGWPGLLNVSVDFKTVIEKGTRIGHVTKPQFIMKSDVLNGL